MENYGSIYCLFIFGKYLKNFYNKMDNGGKTKIEMFHKIVLTIKINYYFTYRPKTNAIENWLII